ncbi:MAG: response regulator [Flavobacteriales bacterium]
MKKIKLAIADDHTLMRTALARLLQDDYIKVTIEAENGLDLISKLETMPVDVVLMDINMPEMNGFETTKWLKKNMSNVKVIALSMFADDASVIRMIRCGAVGYLLKDTEPKILRKAIFEVLDHGVYYSEILSESIIHKASNGKASEEQSMPHLSDREEEFLKLACSDMSMKEIAEKMIVSPRTVDGYREQLFQKLHVSSRIGLVLFAVKHRIYLVDASH